MMVSLSFIGEIKFLSFIGEIKVCTFLAFGLCLEIKTVKKDCIQNGCMKTYHYILKVNCISN